ncbi:MAG: hypothetical protein GTN94_07840 [Candidatus Aminicenantes bacterium]|nr:hypothetical protein [Candidatus Aminicenantes bacterium]
MEKEIHFTIESKVIVLIKQKSSVPGSWFLVPGSGRESIKIRLKKS